MYLRPAETSVANPWAYNTIRYMFLVSTNTLCIEPTTCKLHKATALCHALLSRCHNALSNICFRPLAGN